MPLLPPELPASCLDYATASIRQMLQALLRARTYARRVGGDMWDFAEELATLRNTGIANADLRWLLHHGVISHAEEISRARASRRRFRELGKLMLPEKSSFVLTDLGESLMRRLPTNGRESNGQHRSAPTRPLWHKDIRELYLGKLMVKQFRRPAPNQELVLCAFQEEGWPLRIDDPLPKEQDRDGAQCLHDTINHLNRNQINRALKFAGDGTGRGIRWKMMELLPGS